MAGVVEKSAKREFVKSVVVAVVVVVLDILLLVAQLLGINGVEVGRVRVEQDARFVGRLFVTQRRRKVDRVEEGVLFDLVGAVGADSSVGAGAQGEDEVRIFGYIPCSRYSKLSEIFEYILNSTYTKFLVISRYIPYSPYTKFSENFGTIL